MKSHPPHWVPLSSVEKSACYGAGVEERESEFAHLEVEHGMVKSDSDKAPIPQL